VSKSNHAKGWIEWTGIVLGGLGILLLVIVLYLRTLAQAVLYLNYPNHVPRHGNHRAGASLKKDGLITRRALLK
jgi:hypothetical protein